MFSDKQPSVHRSESETKIQNDELLGIWQRIYNLNGKTITTHGKEMKLIKISTILFSTQRRLKTSTALNETNNTTFEEDTWVYTSKGEESVHEDQWLKIISSITRIDITIVDIKVKRPNSAIRNGTRIQLIKNGKTIAFMSDEGCLCYLKEALIAGFC